MSRLLVAIALCFLSWTATTAAWAEDSPTSRPVDIRIVSAPQDETNHGLLVATWIMVLANALLCGVTWIAARSQSKDMRDSIAVGAKAADAAGRSAEAAVRSSDAANASAQLAARQKREMLERETNIVAHRVATLVARVQELVTTRIDLSNQIFRDFSSMPEKQKLDQMSATTQQASEYASAILASSHDVKLDESLAAELRHLDRHVVQLDAFREQLVDEIADLRRAIQENQEASRRFQDRAEREFNRHR